MYNVKLKFICIIFIFYNRVKEPKHLPEVYSLVRHVGMLLFKRSDCLNVLVMKVDSMFGQMFGKVIIVCDVTECYEY